MPEATILIVEDHEPTLHTLSRVLRDEGYAIVAAHDGAEACALLEAHAPQLVISDVRMPSVDGLRLCALLRERPETRALPVLLCTADNISTAEASLAARLGVGAILLKPVPLAELVSRVCRALGPAPAGA